VELKEKLQKFEYRHRIDQREIGRVLLVASTTLLIFSLHGVVNLSSGAKSLDSLESNYSSVSSMVGTEEFNDTVKALEDVQGGEIGRRMQYAADVFRGLQVTSGQIESAANSVNSLADMYRWLVLLSVLGMVAGISLIYM
jgi:hypothetical protein